MAWIQRVPDDEWSGDLAPLRDRVIDRDAQRIDNIMSVHSLNAASVAAHEAVYRSAMSGTKTLRKVERELIAYIVSDINDCHY